MVGILLLKKCTTPVRGAGRAGCAESASACPASGTKARTTDGKARAVVLGGACGMCISGQVSGWIDPILELMLGFMASNVTRRSIEWVMVEECDVGFNW